MYGKILYGYNDVLSLDTPIKVKRTGHLATVSKVVELSHCTCYHIQPKDPEDLGGNWYLRIGLEEVK